MTISHSGSRRRPWRLRVSAAARACVRLLIVGVTLGLASTAARAESARIAVGRSVADVLRQFQREGLRLIFSSELVTPGLRVEAAPHTTDPRAVVTEILDPHGLTLRPGPRGTWLVVPGRAAQRRDAGPSSATPRSRAPQPPPVRRSSATTPADEPAPVSATHALEEHIDVRGAIPILPAETGMELTSTHVTETAGAFENPLQVLQTLPGTAAVNDREGRLSIRGAESEHNVILLDGVPIRNPFRTSHLPTSLFSPSILSRVTLDASGIDASLSGLSSAIIVDTRDGVSAGRWDGSGSLNLLNGDVLVEGGSPDGQSASWWMNVRGTYYNLALDRFEGGGNRPGFGDAQFKVTLRPSAHTRLNVLGLAGVGEMRDSEPPVALRRSAANNQIALATLHWTPSDRVSSSTSLSAYRDESAFTDGGGTYDPIEPVGFQRYISVQDYGLRHRVTARVARAHRLDAGVEAHQIFTSWIQSGERTPEWLQSFLPNVWGQHNPRRGVGVGSILTKSEVSGWLQDRIRLSPSLEIQPGLRAQWNSLTWETILLPRLLIAHRRGDWRTWTGVSWQAQAPGHETMQQGIALYSFDEAKGSLRAERARQIVAGVERRLGPTLVFRTEAFHRRLDRLLVHRLETDAERSARLALVDVPEDMPADSAMLEHRPVLTPASTGAGRACGIESLVQREASRVSGWLSYTWSKAERTAYGRTFPFDFDRRHALSVVGSIGLTPRTRLAATWQLASGFPFTPEVPDVQFGERDFADRDSDGNRSERLPVRDREGRLVRTTEAAIGQPLATRNSARLALYSRVDLRLSFLANRRWEYYAEVINLFDRRNHTNRPSGDAPIRDVYGGLGVMPTFGLRFTF